MSVRQRGLGVAALLLVSGTGVVGAAPIRSAPIAAQHVVGASQPAQRLGVPSTTPPTTLPPPRLGTNLSGPVDWSVEMPFIDQFKTSRNWISGTADVFDDQRPLDVDADGWVRSLVPGQMARTVVLTDHSEYRPGLYDVTYQGSGTLVFNAPGPATQVGPGHYRVDMSSGQPSMFMTITATDPANPIRNIIVTPPGGTCAEFPETFAADAGSCPAGQYVPFFGNSERLLFHPDFLGKTAPYELIRFMDWMLTNDSLQSSWANRPKVDDARWSVKGIPVEIMVELANRLDVYPWFTLPHLADDDYMRNFAVMVRDRLEPKLTAYVEFSNEVWNSQFQQTRWAGERGVELGFAPADTPWEAGWKYYALRSTEMHKIWVDVFGGRSRLHLVTASQAVSSYVSEQILSFRDTAQWTDSLAIAPYIGEVPNSEAELAPLRSMTVDQYLDRMETKLLPDAQKAIADSKAAADKFGVRLTAYEGGQHVVLGLAVHNDDVLNTLFDNVNRHPRMGAIYTTYLNFWEASGGSVFAHFVNIASWSKYGRWGALESPRQVSSPKFGALMAYLAKRP